MIFLILSKNEAYFDNKLTNKLFLKFQKKKIILNKTRHVEVKNKLDELSGKLS